jgi:hypothetical protein
VQLHVLVIKPEYIESNRDNRAGGVCRGRGASAGESGTNLHKPNLSIDVDKIRIRLHERSNERSRKAASEK